MPTHAYEGMTNNYAGYAAAAAIRNSHAITGQAS